MFSDDVDRRLKEQKKVIFCTARSTDKAKEGQIELEIIFQLTNAFSNQRWKNVHTLQTRLCYFFSLAVLIFWLYTRKLAKDTVLLPLC